MMQFITQQPRIDSILQVWREQIGPQYEGYRGHVYRMFNACLALAPQLDEITKDKLAIAAAFHDIGLWSAQTVDYIDPSVAEAQRWLVAQNLTDWSDEISEMIAQHHKIRPYRGSVPNVELFRKADLVDFSLGTVRFGLPIRWMIQLHRTFPNAGFHAYLIKQARHWFSQHPLTPPPFLRW